MAKEIESKECEKCRERGFHSRAVTEKGGRLLCSECCSSENGGLEGQVTEQQTFVDWVKENLGDYLEDIVRMGADLGFPGITYYKETIKLYEEFESEIWYALGKSFEIEQVNIPPILQDISGSEFMFYLDTFKHILLLWMVNVTVGKIMFPEVYEKEVTDEVEKK